MKIDLFIIQLAIIFFLGLIWSSLDSRYALKSKPSDIQYIIRIMMFGMVSYTVTFGIYSIFGIPIVLVDFSEATSKEIINSVLLKEISSATAVGFGLSIIWLYVSNYKVITRLLQKIAATKTYGDEDVWDFTFNSAIAAVEYVNFRDFENKLVYAGWVREFSETEKLRELVLRDVQVFDFDGVMLFEVPLIYLARKPENLHVEFPYRPEEDNPNGD